MSRTPWFDDARERFERAGEYPLIDDDEIVKSEVLFDFWPWEYGSSGKSKGSADDLLQRALTSDHSDLPVRFVYLNVFWRLAHYPAEQLASFVEDRDSAAGYRVQFLEYLETLVGLVKEKDCEDPKHVRWEIVNACAIRHWDRVRLLYSQLEELAEKDAVAQILAQRGQQELLSVFADRWEMSDPWCWAPLPEEWVSSVLRMVLCYRCAADDFAGPLSDEEFERLRDAAHHLEKGIRAKQDLSLVVRFLLLRCNLVLGKFQEAAVGCEELLAFRRTFGELFPVPGIESPVVSALYSRLVDACRSTGQIERAISANQRWIEEFPDQPGALERLSLLFAEHGDITKAYEYLRKEVDRNPARGEDPAISLALRCGEVYRDPDTRLADFEKQADPQKLKILGAVVTILWPQVRELDARNREDWIRGCHCLVWRPLDDPSVPVLYFGRLVESELRVRIFDQFRSSLRPEEIQPIRTGTDTDPLTKYLKREQPLALGQMVYELDTSPRSRAAKQFRGWLDRENPWLLASLRKIDLKRLSDLYRPAKHRRETPLSWNDAEDVARLCRDLLSAVIRK